MPQAFLTELAESDLAKIWAYIAQDNPDKADHHILKLRAVCEKLAAVPQLGRARYTLAKGIRSYTVGNYLIFYFPTESGIEVARVLHGARDLPRMF